MVNATTMSRAMPSCSGETRALPQEPVRRGASCVLCLARAGIAGFSDSAFYGADYIHVSTAIEPVPGWERFVDSADGREDR